MQRLTILSLLFLACALCTSTTALKTTIYCSADFVLSRSMPGPTFTPAHDNTLYVMDDPISSSVYAQPGLFTGFNLTTLPNDAVINAAYLYYGTPNNIVSEPSNPYAACIFAIPCQVAADISDVNLNYTQSELDDFNNCLELITPESKSYFNFSANPVMPIDITTALQTSLANGYDQFKVGAVVQFSSFIVINAHQQQSDNAYITIDYSVPASSIPPTTTVPITTSPSTSSGAPITSSLAPSTLPTTTRSTTLQPSSASMATTTTTSTKVPANLSGQNEAKAAASNGQQVNYAKLLVAIAIVLATL